MKTILIHSVLVLALLSTIGCSSRGYDTAQIGQNMTVEAGIVQSVKQVVINNEGVGNTLGGIVGAVAGAALGDQIGGGTGNDVATVAGGVIGSVIGGAAGNQMDTNYGQEVIVKLTKGARTVATVLPINEATAPLSVGEAVNVFFSGGKIANISAR